MHHPNDCPLLRICQKAVGGDLGYSAGRWGEARADRYLREIDSVIAAVADGRRRPRLRHEIAIGLSSVRSGSHNVYFKLDDAGQVLHVVAVLHQRMEPSRHVRADE